MAQVNAAGARPDTAVASGSPAKSGAEARPLRTPVVSIGVPVYNGGRFLRRSLDSLLAQTLADFELIISDNASTDATAEIGAEYVSADPRVRYFRQNENVGVARNWNFVAAQARGTYFKWASANDLCDPTLLEKCVAVMAADERVVLCYGRTRLIDEDDQQIEVYPGDLSVCEDRASERFRHMRKLGLNNAQSGVIRLSALRRTGMVRVYQGGDIVLMSELALLGHYRLLPDVLLSRRISKGTFSSMLSREELMKFWDPKSPSVATMEQLRLHRDHILAVLRLASPWPEKASALAAALKNVYWDQAAIKREVIGWLRSSAGR